MRPGMRLSSLRQGRAVKRASKIGEIACRSVTSYVSSLLLLTRADTHQSQSLWQDRRHVALPTL